MMHNLELLPDNRDVPIGPEETILTATLRQHIPHVHACGGKGQCSTCRVQVLAGLEYCSPRNPCEQALADRIHLPPAVRLACQTTTTHNLRIRRPILDNLDIELTRHELEHPDQQLGTEKRVAVLFSDIEDYTSFADELPAYDVIHVLNRYFDVMGEVVRAHHGYISDFIGDGLMVVFGLEHPETAVTDALAAGHAMMRQVTTLNAYLQQMYNRDFHVRIGLHYGPAVVGHIGGRGFRKLATIGDTVNVAARIESANKVFGTYFLVSEAVVEAAGPALSVRQGFLAPLKGKKGLHRLFEVTPEVPPL
ncbi:adenylate/guanylate cyclase domain-containing protein [Hymenobacter terricola]|uniref:adenylate/guanylate cyclase domain-containing protein n=1 Tax=Hymenobacter terricola TaxID=2819236 RepID=UPI001B317BD6|nr:adenylate/guanylate cyclase domain-containing protein [Hymenobacter terricola]